MALDHSPLGEHGDAIETHHEKYNTAPYVRRHYSVSSVVYSESLPTHSTPDLAYATEFEGWFSYTDCELRCASGLPQEAVAVDFLGVLSKTEGA